MKPIRACCRGGKWGELWVLESQQLSHLAQAFIFMGQNGHSYFIYGYLFTVLHGQKSRLSANPSYPPWQP